MPSRRARASTPRRSRRWTRAAWRCSAGQADVNLRVERLGGGDVPVVAVHGDLDIDGVGLSVLLGGRERARRSDGDLSLVASGQGVIKGLELTGLTRVFEIHPS